MAADTLHIRLLASLRDIDPGLWDELANPAISSETDSISSEIDSASSENESEERFNPFLTHAFLSALEDSGSAIADTGWAGAHVLLEDGGGAVLGVAPAYLKSHSQGEYVFDHGWADAYERAGGRYYPKLQVSVPFTPVTGRRLLVRPGLDATAHRLALAQGLAAVMTKARASSVHATFLTEAEQNDLAAANWLPRIDQQYHWLNESYGSFEDFLGTLSARKRKAIRRERRDALAAGITVEHVTGRDLTEAHWDAFFAFYMDTGSRKWGRPYLTRRFFSLLGERLAERVLLVMARRDGRYIAGALNLIGDVALYGRNWGALEHHPFLHFELCYYQAMDFAIARGLKRVEAGAQGEHKLARGYRPTVTRSAHLIRDPGLAAAVADYLARERQAVLAEGKILEDYLPFRRDGGFET